MMARRLGIPTRLEIRLRQLEISQTELALRLKTHQPTISILINTDPAELTKQQLKLLKRIARVIEFKGELTTLLDQIGEE